MLPTRLDLAHEISYEQIAKKLPFWKALFRGPKALYSTLGFW